MPRKLRVEYPGAIYHVMSRGDRREPIFKDDADRKRFLETLAECCGKTGWEVPTVVSRCGNPSLKTDKRPTPKPKWHRITFAPRVHFEWHGDQGETQAMASIAG
jgi:hypothetical protein